MPRSEMHAQVSLSTVTNLWDAPEFGVVRLCRLAFVTYMSLSKTPDVVFSLLH